MSTSLIAAVLAFMVICAVAAVGMNDGLSSVIAMNVFGVLLTILFVMLQAPDVALTQAVINSGLLTALFLVASSRTGRTDRKRREAAPPAAGNPPA